MSSIHHAFPEGFTFTDRIFTPGQTEPETQTTHVPGQAITAVHALAMPDNPQFCRVVKEVEETTRCTRYAYTDKHGYRQYGTAEVAEFNSGGGSQTVKIVKLGWGSDFRRPGTVRGLAAFALTEPRQRFAVVNFMGQGNSTPLPLSRSRAMARTGSYQPAGELFAAAIRQSGIAANAEALDGIGESEGHRVLLGAVGSGALSLRKGVFADGPGDSALGAIGLAWRLRYIEGKHGKQYAAHSNDVWSDELHLATSSGASCMAKRKTLGHVLADYMLHPMALGRNGLRVDTAAALGHISREFTNVSLAASAITNHRRMDVHLGELAATLPADGPTIRHRVGLGLTHAVMCGPGPGPRTLLYAGIAHPDQEMASADKVLTLSS